MKNLLLILLFCTSASVVAQRITISGTVSDERGGPLPGTTVQVKGTTQGTVTDGTGKYIIETSGPNATLVFSFVGYITKEVPAQGQTTINVILSQEILGLEEVVVTALGITREAKALSYSQQGVDVALINETKSTNIVNSLSGKIAGVQVVPSGYNTGSARIVIRGNNSLTGNNQPLFVVDGLPIDNTAGDGRIDYGNNAAALNPEDIESMEVLKGPNASALYGSRAANGVILITTKKGSSQFKVTLNSNFLLQTITEFPEYQNAYGVGTSFYIDRTNMIPKAVVNYRSWGSPMLGQPYVALDGVTKPYLPQPDNVKSFYQTAQLITNSVSIEGGNKENIIRFSYTNYNGSSVVDGVNDQKKNTFNLRVQNNFIKWLKLDSKINFVRDNVRNRQYSNDNGRNPSYMYVHMARSTALDELIPWKDEFTGMEIGTHRNFSNPYWIRNENPNEDTKDRLISSINPEIIITDWLKIIGRIGADLYWMNGYEFNNMGSIQTSNPNGYMSTFNTVQQNFNIESILSVNKKLNDFSLVANFGATRFNSKYENREAEINSLLQPGLINLSNAAEYPMISQTARKKRLNSVFGAISLGYRDFAYIDITGRNDWSSTLPINKCSYFYPSVGGTLLITELLKLDSDILSFAKVRASYAMVGNDSDPYRLQQTFSFTGFFNDAIVAEPGNIMNNPELKPEKTSSFEIGADLRFFHNRFSIDATYYSTSTVNQIITASLPTSSGYERRIYNAGEIENNGYEITLRGNIIRTSDFSWESIVNFSKNNSLVVSLLEDIERFQLANRSSYMYVFAEVGKPYGYLRGLGVKLDDQGRMLMDAGGSLLTKDTDKPYGTSNPDWLAGFSNTFSYKGFDLYALVDFKKGGVLWSGSWERMVSNCVLAETLYGRDDYYLRTVIWGESGTELTGGAQYDAYYADGLPANHFMSSQSYEYCKSHYADWLIFDASFIKLRELSLGYNFSPGFLSRTPIKNARISLTGRNLLILHANTPVGLDPEASFTSGNGQGIENGSLPPNAVYGINIRLTL